MFKDVKVGDKVWDVQFGWGMVEEVTPDDFDVLFVEPDLDGDRVEGTYRFDGRANSWVRHPSLFWDEIKFEAPAKPVRLVDRTFECWVNLYAYQDPYFHPDRETADRKNANRVACYEASVTIKDVPEGVELPSVWRILHELT